jgi:hypothetical protein
VGNGRDYNTKADIYSLGRILNDLFDIDDRYELICDYFESLFENYFHLNTFSKNIIIDNKSSVFEIEYKHLCDLFEK